MTAPLMVGVRRWTQAQLAGLARLSDGAAGVILGDPLCPWLASEYGNWGIPALAAMAKGQGLMVALQTPVYLTTRNWDDTLNLTRMLQEQDSLDLLIVQDIGLLAELQAADCRVPVCWGLWGRTRADSLSRSLLDLLIQLGVQYWETDRPSRVGPFQDYGFKVMYRAVASRVKTFSRFCYTQYVTASVCQGDLCLRIEPELVSHGGLHTLKVRGFTLEHTQPANRPTPVTIPDLLAVYVDDVAHLAEAMGNG